MDIRKGEYMSEATIAAISTPTGTGGISIVRMSGDKSKDIIDKIFSPLAGGPIDRKKDNRRMRYGNIVDGDEVIDEVMVSFMAGPATYTREDIVEINCHGSFISVKKILNLVLDSGAVLAEPGEFTKRAFLNGRIDLSQAEAVLDIINSTNDMSQAQGINQLRGSLKEEIDKIRQSLLEALSRLEYSINFTDMFFLALSTQTGYTFSTHNSYILEAKKLYHSLYVYLFLYLVVIILANVLLIKLHKRKKRNN